MKAFTDAAHLVAHDPVRAARVERASLSPLLPILWRWTELQRFSSSGYWPLPQSKHAAFEKFAQVYKRNGFGLLNVYEAGDGLDQSPLDWLEQELFAPAVPALEGYESHPGFIGLSSTGGSVLCPNMTCAQVRRTCFDWLVHSNTMLPLN